jgi:hypothetical protein
VLKSRFRGVVVAIAICASVLVSACASSTSVPQAVIERIAGAPKCPASETQDLSFTGAITGHLVCSSSPVACSTGASTPSLVVPISAHVGSSAVQPLIVFRFFRENLKTEQLGTYPAGRQGEESNSLSYGATLDGIGHWETPSPGGSMTLSTDDATGASGSVDIKLTDGKQTLAISGSWRCARAA